MQLSAKLTMIVAGVFAAVCLGIAIKGFSSLGEITDPQQLADAKGFAWFWMFLAGVGVVFALLSRWLGRTDRGEDADA